MLYYCLLRPLFFLSLYLYIIETQTKTQNMKANIFQNCQSIEEVKKMYKTLAMENHPDKGGNTEKMQEINADYQAILKNPVFKFEEFTQEEKETIIIYPEIIDKIINLDGIVIEIIGKWLWLSGNTYAHKAIIKELGFFFAPQKAMWYYRPADAKVHKRNKPLTIDKIRTMYGSEEVKREFSNCITA